MLKLNKALQTKWQWISTVVLLTLVGLFVGSTPPLAHAATFTSAATGNWSAGTTWVGGIAPTATDDVVIAAGHMVMLDAGATVNNITIDPTGTFQLVNFTLDVRGNWTNNGNVGMLSTASVNFNGTGAQTIGGTGINNFSIMNISNTGGTVTLVANATATDVTIAAGSTLAAGSFTLDVKRNWTNDGTFTAGTGTVKFNGTGPQTIAGTVPTTFNTMSISNAVGTVTLGANATVGSIDILAGATLDAATFTLNVKGDWTNIGGTFTAGTGTVNFNNGVAGQVIGGTVPTTFNIMNISNSSALGVTLGANATATDVTISGGSILDAFMSNIDVKGNWTNNGTFTASGGGTSTVSFNGTGAQTIGGTTATTFHKMAISNGGRTVTFANNVTLGATSNWAGGGSCAALLSIRSSAAGTGRTVTNGAFLIANFVDVQDSILTTGVTAANGVKGTNSTNWTITTVCAVPTAPTGLNATAASAPRKSIWAGRIAVTRRAIRLNRGLAQRGHGWL